MDAKDGVNKSEGTWNYKPPNNKDVPQIFNVELLPGNKSSRTLYGSKGYMTDKGALDYFI